MMRIADSFFFIIHNKLSVYKCEQQKAVILISLYKIALKTYNRVISKKDITLLKNSCDFAILEQAYSDYSC